MALKDSFQINLIKELGLDDLPEEKKQEYVIKIGDLIQQRIILRILDELGDIDKDEFDRMLGENDDEKTFTFLQKTIPNLDEIIKDEIGKFKQEAMARMQAVAH